MPAKVVKTDKAPAPLGPYSQGWIAGNLVFTAGQVGMLPGTKKLVEGGIAEQTRQTMQNIAAVLEAAGTTLERVVKTTVFLARVEDAAAMSAVYKQFFPGDPPARSTITVGLPLGALVEIEAVATLD